MKYFTLDNPSALIELHGRSPMFTYREYNFNEDLNAHLRVLQSILYHKKFRDPGFNLEFFIKEKTAEVKIFRAVSLKHKVFIGSDAICIGKYMVSMHEDYTGSLCVFLGDLNDDEAWQSFIYGNRFNSKLNGKPRTYASYEFDQESRTFIGYNDMGREYDLDENDKQHYELFDLFLDLETMLRRINHGLTNDMNVTDIINSPSIEDIFFEPDPIMLTNELFKNKSFVTYMPEDTTVKPSPVPRLLSLSALKPKHPLADEMQEGFAFFDIVDCDQLKTDNIKPKNVWGWMIPGVERNGSHLNFCFVPKTYQNVFVIDGDSDAEHMTLVHINDYEGTYKKPIIVCNRTLQDDELYVQIK